ncbi:MAG: hypothetical protein HFF38_00555 [Lawsonibacter sp.]|nr:hypothetical protein [Lawsonibacter sp.]
MFQQAPLKKLDDYFVPLPERPEKSVYFYRFAGNSPEVTAFLRRYYEAARQGGVIIDGRLPNPDPGQLAYFGEMMGTDFQRDCGFLSQRLAKWLPRMSPGQREAVASAMASTLEDMLRQGKNENMLRNAYIKYMCWLYYRFERIVNRLGTEVPPKILYDGAISVYELQLFLVLSRAGADLALLEREGDEGYRRLDPSSQLSRLYQAEGLSPFPPHFSLQRLREELARDVNRRRLYGAPPKLEPCTNAWMERPELNQLLTSPSLRGGEGRFFYNSFLAQYGVPDRLTFSADLFGFYQRLKSEGRRVCVVNGSIPVPTPEEVAAVPRKNYRNLEQMAGDLAQNIRCPASAELQSLMVKGFLDLVLEEGGPDRNVSRAANQAVYLLCWLKRWQKELFEGWKPPEVPVFLLFGGGTTEHEARFLRLLAKLPVDVALLQPSLDKGSCLRDPALLELRYEDSLSMEAFPAESGQLRVSTAAYQAERDLDGMMYQDTGLYRNQQYAKAEAITLRTMYEEIAILWDQELKYRPSFQVNNGMVTLPVLLEKICGVKDGDVGRYWLEIKKLMTPETLVVPKLPWTSPLDENPMRAGATQFLRNGRLLKDKIKAHKAYPYGILRGEMQDYLLDKLQLLLDRRTIAGTYQNGTEYTVIAAALNLKKELLRLLQKFDFTKKNPKLIVIHTSEEILSLEDGILFAFLNLLGFDILFFVPTGYQCIERYFTAPFANEQQIGEYLYDLPPPDFTRISERGRGSIRKWFGRS